MGRAEPAANGIALSFSMRSLIYMRQSKSASGGMVSPIDAMKW